VSNAVEVEVDRADDGARCGHPQAVAHDRRGRCAATGELLGEKTVAVGFASLLVWARGLAGERGWALEDCRHVAGSFERFVIARGERVLRVPTELMADARRAARTRGKSDRIDAVAVARAALREGLEALAAAHLDGPELDVRLLVDHRERLVRRRVGRNNTLQWHLHDLWPELVLPGGAWFSANWSTRIARRLARADQTMRVRIADSPRRRDSRPLPPRDPGLHRPQAQRRQDPPRRRPLPQAPPGPPRLAPPATARAHPGPDDHAFTPLT